VRIAFLFTATCAFFNVHLFSDISQNDFIYPLSLNKIAAVCLIDSEHDQKDAGSIATQRGVTWMCKHGFKFIKIESEEKIMLFTAPSESPNDSVYSDNFSKTLPDQNFPDSDSTVGELASQIPAVRVIVVGSKDDPKDSTYFTCPQNTP